MNTSPIRLTKISLSQFRHYQNLSISLDSDLVFFIGNNGVGKTSILEAISLISILKSFRTNSEKDIISSGSSFYTIDIEYNSKIGKNRLYVGYGNTTSSKTRSLFFNKDRVEKISDFIGKFQTVIFSPDDVQIVDSDMNARRSFIDMAIASVDKQYLQQLQVFKRTMKMRSQMLKTTLPNNYDPIYFLSINKEIAKVGSQIQKTRLHFFNDFQTPFRNYISEISDNRDNWALSYRPSISHGEDESIYLEALEKSISNDLRVKQTLKGVHRDNIYIISQDKPNLDLKQIASQGQKRTAALSLKMAQFIYAKNKTQETPVLLIDDILNELDINRRTKFINFLNDIGQALITTTDIIGLDSFIQSKKESTSIRIFNIKQEKDQVPSIEETIIS